MSQYQNILISVDLSKHSRAIIDRAVELIAGSDVSLHLVHVIEPVIGDYSFESKISDYEKVQHAHREAVEHALSQLLYESELALPKESIHLLDGHPARQIRQLCDELGVDLLVIGSHGYNAMLSMLGSTTSAVMHGINCDVLTVRIS